MNTFANLGGAIAPVAMGYAVQWWGSWSTPLVVTAAVCVTCGLLTLAIDPSKHLMAPEAGFAQKVEEEQIPSS